ncbi:MAG: hypothetical protein AB7T31_04165 [Gemmatimonadales bacterium]
MLRRVLLATCLGILTAAPSARAQTAQRWSIQLSALGVELTSVTNDDLRFGGGVELQARYNPSALSIGFGFQTTRHQLQNQLLARDLTVTYTGGFVEPRLILGSLGDFLAFYAATRFMVLNAKFDVGGVETKVDGAAIAGGGGILVRITDRVNAELGATAGKEYYNRNAENGTTLVTRLGVALGL